MLRLKGFHVEEKFWSEEVVVAAVIGRVGVVVGLREEL
jgi:hypothetical protein